MATGRAASTCENSRPQLSATLRALRNDYRIELPLVFGHWLRLRKAELQA